MGKDKSLRDVARENVEAGLAPFVPQQGVGLGEVRTTSSTGGQKGVKPRKFGLLPWKALGVIAEHFGIGAEKYAAHNWREGYEWSKTFDALQRHLGDWWEGEERDEDGLHNLAAAGFHILVLITYAITHPERYAQFDDRYKAPEPEKKLATGGYVIGSTPIVAEGYSHVHGPYYTQEQVRKLGGEGLKHLVNSGSQLPKVTHFTLGTPIVDSKGYDNPGAIVGIG